MIWPFKPAPTIAELKRIDDKEILFRLSDGRWIRCRCTTRTATNDRWHAYWEESGEEVGSSRVLEIVERALRKESWAEEERGRAQKVVERV